MWIDMTLHSKGGLHHGLLATSEVEGRVLLRNRNVAVSSRLGLTRRHRTKVVDWPLTLEPSLNERMFCFEPLTTLGIGRLQGPNPENPCHSAQKQPCVILVQ